MLARPSVNRVRLPKKGVNPSLVRVAVALSTHAGLGAAAAVPLEAIRMHHRRP